MATYRSIIYMALDELKLYSGDSDFTPDHLMFLAIKYRALLLDRKYRDVRKVEVPQSNYQTICLDLEKVEAVPGQCYGGYYLKSTVKIPNLLKAGLYRVYPIDYLSSPLFTWVTPERFQFVGHNNWLGNMIYITRGVDDYLYLKSSNPQLYYLKKLQLNAVFSEPEKAYNLRCGADSCDIIDSEFPIEEELVSTLVQMLVEELSGAKYQPDDKDNNASDDLAGIPVKS